MSIESVVIVGAGQAGHQVAASLRQDGFAGRVTLIGEEPGLPYQRPPLSKAYLLGKVTAGGLLLRQESWFADQKVELLTDRATAIDRANQRISLASGGSANYDHLVLATGTRNRMLTVPGADLPGVIGMRTLDDADALLSSLKDARDVVVIGAGFIGLEFAAVAAVLGKSVHVLELADRPMARAVSKPMAQLFRNAHESNGITFDFGQGLSHIEGVGGRASVVVTTDGRRLPADLVVYGIGVLPNVELAAGAGLDIENGIRVDANLLTRDPAISAIGDAAAFPSAHVRGLVRLESVQNAMDQARNVAARLMGRPSPYSALPWFWSDQGGLKLQIAGLSTGHDQAVILDGATELHSTVLCFADGALVAIETCNRPPDHMVARKILARSPTLTPDVATAPGFDLRRWEAETR